jgi:hypothetical protein
MNYFDAREQRSLPTRPISPESLVWEVYIRKSAFSKYVIRLLYEVDSGDTPHGHGEPRLKEARFIPVRAQKAEEMLQDLKEVGDLCQFACSVQHSMDQTFIVGDDALVDFIAAENEPTSSDWRSLEVDQLVLSKRFELSSAKVLGTWNTAGTTVSTPVPKPATPIRASAGSAVKVVVANLVKFDFVNCSQGCYYLVKGSVYNPTDTGMNNVVIRYRIWKKFMGMDRAEYGSIISENGGLVSAVIKYLPPKVIVEFTAEGGHINVMSAAGLNPDPLEAEITADWADQ